MYNQLSVSGPQIDSVFADLQEEENGSERNVYKVRAFKNAITAVQGLDRTLVDGDDAKKVGTCSVHHAPLPSTPFRSRA